jgi:hypothetical protein
MARLHDLAVVSGTFFSDCADHSAKRCSPSSPSAPFSALPRLRWRGRMIGQFINGPQFVIYRQRRLSPPGHVKNHLLVKFVNSSRRTLARVLYVRVHSHSIRIDELMILMNLYYYNRNQELTTTRSFLIISAGFDEFDARPAGPTLIRDLTASTLEGWSGAVVPDRTTPPPPPLHDPGGIHASSMRCDGHSIAN